MGGNVGSGESMKGVMYQGKSENSKIYSHLEGTSDQGETLHMSIIENSLWHLV